MPSCLTTWSAFKPIFVQKREYDHENPYYAAESSVARVYDEVPNCGRGHLFRRFLCCGVCGEDYTPQRADDFPAYLVIIVVGHVVVPALLAVEIAFAPPDWPQLLIWLPVTGLSALALLQPTKGTIVGLQWHSGMHGFEASKRQRDKEAADVEARLIQAPIQSGTILGLQFDTYPTLRVDETLIIETRSGLIPAA